MSATVLVHGRLHRDPQSKVSGKGNAFAMATLRSGNGDDAQWWRCFAFQADARDELLTLRAGDGVAVSGSFKAEIYAGSGEPRVSLTVTADRIITAKKQKQERPRQQAPAGKAALRDSPQAPPAFDDECPF